MSKIQKRKDREERKASIAELHRQIAELRMFSEDILRVLHDRPRGNPIYIAPPFARGQGS